MQKSKLGVSVGVLASLLFFANLFNNAKTFVYLGSLITILIAGYILIAENNAWLRKTAVKAVALTVFFALIPGILNLVPSIADVINEIIGLFGGSLYIGFTYKAISAIVSLLSVVERILFIILGVLAFSEKSVKLAEVDKLTENAFYNSSDD